MRKILLLILILFISKVAFGPEAKSVIYISKPFPIDEFGLLVDAVVKVESNGNHFAFNPDEGAVGAFQIRQIRVDDYNIRRGTNFKLTDFYDYNLSREMFIFYLQFYSDFETAVRRWNGSGVMTDIYWSKVQKFLK